MLHRKRDMCDHWKPPGPQSPPGKGRAGDTARTHGCLTKRGVKHGSAGTYGRVGGAGEPLEARGKEMGGREDVGRAWVEEVVVKSKNCAHETEICAESCRSLIYQDSCIDYLFISLKLLLSSHFATNSTSPLRASCRISYINRDVAKMYYRDVK